MKKILFPVWSMNERFSLVSVEEVAHMLDLHPFLGRGLNVADINSEIATAETETEVDDCMCVLPCHLLHASHTIPAAVSLVETCALHGTSLHAVWHIGVVSVASRRRQAAYLFRVIFKWTSLMLNR